jgi:spore maturation protein CgeB
MTHRPYRITFIGLSITSSWGNGHATTYRGLLRELEARGHEVTFLERDLPFYAAHRDLPSPAFARTILYGSTDELFQAHRRLVLESDLVVVGSYTVDGCEVGAWVCDLVPGRAAFYDIDTPITLQKMDAGDDEYVSRALLPRYDLVLSFTGGPTLRRLEAEYGARRARPLYCSVDPALYAACEVDLEWDLGYLGTYSADRQPMLDRLLTEVAERLPSGEFIVAGAQYPASVRFPENVQRVDHIPPGRHPAFYCAQRWTLNVTREAMIAAGWSPSVRLFEAAACGTPIVSDAWPGLGDFLTPGREIVVARDAGEVLRALEMPESERLRVGRAARERVLAEHTAAHRAEALERYTTELLETRARRGAGHAKGWEAAE